MSITSGVLLFALLISSCSSSRPTVHTGALPTGEATIAPHVIQGTELPPDATAQPTRTLPFGLREDQLPLGITSQDLALGAVAAGILLGSVTLAFGIASITRLARRVGRQAPPPPPLEVPGVVFDGLSRFPAEHTSDDRIRVTHTGTIATTGAPPVAHSSMSRAIPVSQAVGAPEATTPAPAPADSAPPPVLVPAAPTQPHPAGPSFGQRLGRSLGALAARTRDASAGSADRAGSLARWTGEHAQASGRVLAAIPRAAWNDIERRRSPFRDNGEFWEQGITLLRMGVQQEAERHYWSGFYECESRGWEVEGAECLRRLGQLALFRGEAGEALRQFEAAAATFELRHDTARLAAVRDDILEATEAATRASSRGVRIVTPVRPPVEPTQSQTAVPR